MKIDPSDEIRLSNSTRHIAVQATPISFDGCSNACLHIQPDHIIFDSIVPAVDVDEIFSKKKRVPDAMLEVMNHYLEYLRRHGIRYAHPAEVEKDFFSWLAAARSPLLEQFMELERRMECVAGGLEVTPAN